MGAAILRVGPKPLRRCSNQGTFRTLRSHTRIAAGDIPLNPNHQANDDTMTTDTAAISSSKDKLVADLKVLMADSEELLRASAGQAGEKISAARERVQASLASAKVKLSDAERAAVEQARKAAKVTDEYVHENPWRAVGIAACAGLVLGVLISRR